MDNELLNFGLRAFIMLFAIVDPVGNVPIFVTVTHSLDASQRRRLAGKVCLVAAGVLAAFAVGGTAVLWAFHLTMPAIRIAGGIILLVIALQMLSGRQFHWPRGRSGASSGQAGSDTGIVPMAIPMMAGPAAMSSVLALSTQASASGPMYLAAVLLSVVLVCAIAWVCYRAAIPLMHRLGRTVMVTFSCVMGLILAALAVQFMLDGLAEAIPSLFAAAS